MSLAQHFVTTFGDQIQLQQRAIRSHRITAYLLAIGGVGLMVYAARQIQTIEVLKLGIEFFFSSIAVVPLRDVWQRKERVVSFTHLKYQCENCELLAEEEQKQLLQMAMKALEETAKR